MADLLGSILGAMEKPPTIGDSDRKKANEQKKLIEKQQQKDKERLEKFRSQIQKRINDFVKDNGKEKFKFEPMDKVFRAIVHEVADVAGLTSFSFGEEEVDRYVMLWKKEFAPSDDELSAYRRGEEWDPEKAKELAKQKEAEEAEDRLRSQQSAKMVPSTNYKEKYEHLLGKVAAKDAAQITTANRSYGFVPSENKRDNRTIEQVMAESKARKKLKTDHQPDSTTSDVGDAEEIASSGPTDLQSL